MVKKHFIIVLITLSTFLLCGVCSADFKGNSSEKSLAYHIINDALQANHYEGVKLPEHLQIMISQAREENDKDITDLLKKYTINPEEKSNPYVCCHHLTSGHGWKYSKVRRTQCKAVGGSEVSMSNCE